MIFECLLISVYCVAQELPVSLLLVWAFGFAIWTMMTVLIYLPTHRMWTRLPRASRVRVYVFPLLHSTVCVRVRTCT